MKRIEQIEKNYMQDKLPQFKAGDTLRIHIKIKEGEKERIQVFQGTVIGRRGGGTGATFTVRKVSGGVGVERIFPLHSPNIDRIERIKVGSVRRAKLNYLRKLTGKSARIKEQIIDSERSLTKTVEETVQQGSASKTTEETVDTVDEDTIDEGQPKEKETEKTKGTKE